MRVSLKLYQEQVRLTKWFAAISALSIATFFLTSLYLHNVILLVGSLMIGPIFILMTLVFGAIAISTKLKLRK